jgi:phytoene dehydrogenase-like protein
MANSAGCDTIVIGGGIAGLSAAAHLAKAGKQVVLFEQHDKPGGYYPSFVRDGIIFDSAIGMLLYIGFALRGSAYQPKGGASKAAEAFAAAGARNGVKIRYGERVKSIITEAGRVCGVMLESGETVRSHSVVAAVDIRQTFHRFFADLISVSRVPQENRR